jgi:hypothetical protein
MVRKAKALCCDKNSDRDVRSQGNEADVRKNKKYLCDFGRKT